MEIKNYTQYSDEDIGLLTFSRYVKISSLGDLLNGKIFIPSFDIVRKADPQELGIPAYSYAFLERDFFNHSNFEQEQSWLEQKWQERIGTAFRDVGEVRERMLLEQWIYEIGRRRCVWCWFVSSDSTEHSAAMWNLYARDGVLIRTTWKAIQDTLADESRYEAGLFKVEYVSVGDHDERFSSSENLRRPFLFKSKGYKHEQEMRIVFQDEGKWVHPGIELSIDYKKLIKQLTFSPYLSRPEVKSLRRIVPSQSLPGVVIDHAQHGLEEPFPTYFEAPSDESPSTFPASIKTL